MDDFSFLFRFALDTLDECDEVELNEFFRRGESLTLSESNGISLRLGIYSRSSFFQNMETEYIGKVYLYQSKGMIERLLYSHIINTEGLKKKFYEVISSLHVMNQTLSRIEWKMEDLNMYVKEISGGRSLMVFLSIPGVVNLSSRGFPDSNGHYLKEFRDSEDLMRVICEFEQSHLTLGGITNMTPEMKERMIIGEIE